MTALLRNVRAAIERALTYYRRYGWRSLFHRLLHVQFWLPRILGTRRQPPLQRPTLADLLALPFGVNVVGGFSGSGSMADISRLAAAALKAAGVPFATCDMTLNTDPHRQESGFPIDNANPYRFNLFFSLPTPEDLTYAQGRDIRSGRYNICFRPWEFSEVPPIWHSRLAEYDEIWVPSSFVSEALVSQFSQPIACIPHPIAPRHTPTIERSPHLASLPADATIFLFVYNYTRASHGRKNPAGAIAAFKRAFSAADNVWLVIKAGYLTDRHVRRELESLAAGANVLFIEDWLSPAELDALVASCDCYVSLHRTEGFGLTIADAMAFARPVITTAYSGNLDFTTPENSYLVNYKLVPLERDHGAYQKGWLWADPDIDHAAALMRQVYENPDEARLVGERARADIQRQLSFEAVGELMKQRLIEISADLEAAQAAPAAK